MKISNHFMNLNQFYIQLDTGWLCVETITPNIYRVRCTLRDEFKETPSLMIVPPASMGMACIMLDQGAHLLVETDEIRLEVLKDTAAFTWRNQDGDLLLREPQRGGKHLHEIQVENSGQPPLRQSRKAYTTKLEFEFAEGEAIYGLGQHEEGVLNYRGHSQYLYQNNMKIAMPVLVSSRGWGILFDSYSLGVFHDDQYGSYYSCDTEDELDYYFIYGPTFDRIIEGIRDLTGQPPMLPRWAYGYLQSKERYKDQNELVDIVRQYRDKRIPLDGIIQDWQYWDEGAWGQKTFDTERYPDPAGMMRSLHELHAHALISVWPNFEEVEHKKPFVEGDLLLPDNKHYNVFDPEARALHWQQMNEGIFQYGLDGWWCDSTEPYDGMFFYDAKYRPEPWERAALNKAEFTRNVDPEFINVYSLLNSQGVYEGQRSVTEEKRVVNLTRSAFPGQQRYGTIVWSGDTAARWDTLKWHIPAGLNVTVTGFPNWTFDIGAFFVKDKRDTRWWWSGDFPEGVDDLGYRELYVRWFQYAAFLPMFRSHGTDIDREIFRFGEPGDPFFDTLLKFDILRYRLLPYIYSLAAWEHHKNYTMHRMLAFDFIDDPRVLDITDQFMLGPALLVCPVTEPMYYGPNSKKLDGVPKLRRLYLPKGSDWYDFWTGERYSGGQEITAPAHLEILPLFVRAGSILPMGQVVMHTSENPFGPLEIRVYPGRDIDFDLYEDEGDSYRYEQGAYAWRHLEWDEQSQNLVVLYSDGGFAVTPLQREINWLVVQEGVGVG
jgi:alpha-D-xyloside xylohydrolase